MFKLIALLLGLFVPLVFSAEPAKPTEAPLYVYEEGATSIRLMRGACVDEMSLLLLTQFRNGQFLERARAIESDWVYRNGNRKALAGCWAEVSKEESGGTEVVFLLVFSDRDSFVFLKSAFTNGKGTET